MIWLIFFYLVLPFTLGAYVIKLIRKHGASTVDPELAKLPPLEKRWFRAVRRDAAGAAILGDFETQTEAVEAAYRAREQAPGRKASYQVVNDKAEVLEQIDA